jgi:hypothetical protein
MSTDRFHQPPRSLRRAKLDNLALVPASLLPFRAEYQAIANQQPAGTTLVVLPVPECRQRSTLECVANGLRAKGRRVTTISAEAVCQATLAVRP